MADSAMSVSTVEAWAVPSYNCMGLPQANHILLVSQDHRSFGWPCFGRDFSDPHNVEKVLVDTAQIYKEWAMELAPPNNEMQYLAGVAVRVNGTCHSLANRILALSDDDNNNVAKSSDDSFSVVVFGKYGFGTKQFCELLTQSFNNTVGQTNPLLDKVLQRVKNPFKDELNSWKIVINDVMHINIDQMLEVPGLADEALAVITSYCNDRDSMYEQCFNYKLDRAPNDEEKGEVWEKLKELALKYVDNVLNALAKANDISSEQRDDFNKRITGFIDSLNFSV